MARGLKVFGALCVFIAGLSQLCVAVSIQQYEYDPRSEGWWRLHSEPVTWLEAKLRCQSEGGILASPTTVSLFSSMKLKMGEIRSVFTGLHANSSGGDFMSIDGIPLSNVPTPWARGEPNRLGDDEDCLAMSNIGELADVSCSRGLPYFCYKSKAAMAENVCDTNNGYTFEPRTGSCYKVHNEVLPWHRAAMFCAAEHAHLAVINSEAESEVLKELFAKIPWNTLSNFSDNYHAHIGFMDWNGQSQWMTIFGEPIESVFHKWARREPSHPGEETCGSMTDQGLLNDEFCTTHYYPFICETPLK